MRPHTRYLDLAMALFGAISLVVVLWLTCGLSVETGDALTRNTIRLSLAWYAAALVSMLRLEQPGWNGQSAGGSIARWCWTWSVIAYLVHLAMAFHYFHDWSHAHAFEHTRQTSGFGEGIFLSYLFTLLWISDAMWWWLWPDGYAQRPSLVGYSLHVFMLFIVFNGMVVFASGAIRWAGLLMYVVLFVAWRFSPHWQMKSPGTGKT